MPQLSLFDTSSANLEPSDIKDKPKELLDQLNINEATVINFSIISIIDNNKKVASADRIIVALYNQTGIIYKRKNMLSRLGRMVKKNQIYLVPNKKSMYTTINPNETN